MGFPNNKLHKLIITTLIAALIVMGGQAFAAEADSDCDTRGDEATRSVVRQCLGNAFCSKVMLAQETCPKLKHFTNWLVQFSSGVFDGDTVFLAIAPKFKVEDSAFDAAMTLSANLSQQSKKGFLQDSDFDGRLWIYEGGVLKGKRYGYGVMLLDDGRMFRGEFVSGKQSGQGDRVDKDGTRSIGNMRDMKLSGQGARRYADGKRYDGDFANDKPCGKGVYVQPDGLRYEGDWDEEKITGKGKVLYTDGAVYEGDVVNGFREGMGEIRTKDGQHYLGQWKAGFRSGQGTQEWSDGTSYKGGWEKNDRNGEGIFLWKDGSKYEGSWIGGKRQGHGVLTNINGNKYVGNWVAGNMHGQGVFSWSDGSKFEGELNDETLWNGVKTNADGSKVKIRGGKTAQQATAAVAAQFDSKIQSARDACKSEKSSCDAACAATALLRILAKSGDSNQNMQCMNDCEKTNNNCLGQVARLEQEQKRAIDRAMQDFR